MSRHIVKNYVSRKAKKDLQIVKKSQNDLQFKMERVQFSYRCIEKNTFKSALALFRAANNSSRISGSIP
jgi:hypothetical protein